MSGQENSWWLYFILQQLYYCRDQASGPWSSLRLLESQNLYTLLLSCIVGSHGFSPLHCFLPGLKPVASVDDCLVTENIEIEKKWNAIKMCLYITLKATHAV